MEGKIEILKLKDEFLWLKQQGKFEEASDKLVKLAAIAKSRRKERQMKLLYLWCLFNDGLLNWEQENFISSIAQLEIAIMYANAIGDRASEASLSLQVAKYKMAIGQSSKDVSLDVMRAKEIYESIGRMEGVVCDSEQSKFMEAVLGETDEEKEKITGR